MALRRRSCFLLLFGCFAWLTSCRPSSPPPITLPPTSALSQVTLRLVAGNFQRPTYLTHAFDDRLFVVEQAGRVIIVRDGQALSPPFLDITDRVGAEENEQGLLSLAFHPQNPARFFVDYTDKNGDTVIAEFAARGENADPSSERVLLTIPQPYGNHNGGQLQFGADGYLYVGMGDGGSGGDPEGNGQNKGTLLGALLRLDVDQAQPYAIPADNPFVDERGSRGEIWAYGLRNPWRFSFDRLTGDLYVGDVGQDAWEELDVVGGEDAGINFGWNTLEGTHCYRRPICNRGDTTPPILEYDHGDGCSITGGYVYRGAQYPTLYGRYFFSDYCRGDIWSMEQTENGWQRVTLRETDLNIASFGEDAAGELYVLDLTGGGVYHLQP
ncbi:MAG: PQQ-dependent sugar dehydrogenase [Ardenticatenales bacterium]|nr:PQQ-dependent sugar dehydrogenase [Ardenticatenales bacterium]